MKFNNKYYILRHGEALSNVEDLVSCWPEKFHNPLTEAGVDKIKKVAEELKNKNIDLIFSSPLLRTKQTSEVVASTLGLKIKFDKRLRELDFGTFNGKSAQEFVKYFKDFNDLKDRMKTKTPGGENYAEISKRVISFFKEINGKYKGKNILVISHQAPLLLLRAELIDASVLDSIEELKNIFKEKRLTKGELLELN